MAMVIGSQSATSGMAKAIYDAINAILAPAIPPASLPDVQASWKKLSFAVATGVVNHLKRAPAADPEYAQVVSRAVDDPGFWNWLAGFVQVFQAWAPVSADAVALKTALTTYLGAHPVPSQLTGTLE